MAPSDRERWNARYAGRSHEAAEPSPWLSANADLLPKHGRALDVAGGAGRHGLWLARRGLAVTVVDVADTGLAIAAKRAADEGLTVTTERRDLEVDPLPPGPWDVVTWFDYLNRARLQTVAAVMRPGAVLVLCHPTTENLQRNAKPSARFLLDPGEIGTLLGGLAIVRHEEGWDAGDRHTARVVARAR